MSGHDDKQAQADPTMTFDCCGARMADAMVECPCRSIVRRHPVLSSVVLAVLGTVVLMIPAGAILGIIAFLRTI